MATIYRPRGITPDDWEELILLAKDYRSHAYLTADPHVNADPGRVATVLAEACVRVLLADIALGTSCGKRHVVPPETPGDAGHEWHCLRSRGHDEQCRPYTDRTNTTPYPSSTAEEATR